MAHYVIDTSTSVGSRLQSALNHLRAAKNEIDRAHSIMDTARGSPADYTKIEGGAFGIAAGEGDEVFGFVNSVKTEIAGLTESFIAAIDQGG
jgi:hypothetical protein